MGERTSIIWTTSREDLEKLVNESASLNQILHKMGYVNFEGNHRTLKERIKKENIDMTSLKERGRIEKLERMKIVYSSIKKDDSEIFTEKSNFSRQHLKKRILKNKMIPYVCSDCGNQGIWNNRVLVLHLEHINGIGNDNRIENLCFLCPNCHSQTSTYAGKNNKDKVKKERRLSIKRTCPKCGKEKDRGGNMCRDCYRKSL
jgi:predicted RNA-binding Zn-ribbon protein involved in translation (DUF1610 family)